MKLPSLQVRLHFKVAFLNEFRKDVRAALTAYIKVRVYSRNPALGMDNILFLRGQAYELLLIESDIADAGERMEVCNHITIRTPGHVMHAAALLCPKWLTLCKFAPGRGLYMQRISLPLSFSQF